MWDFSNDKDSGVKAGLLVEGIYNVAIAIVEMRDTKKGDKMLVLGFKVLDDNGFGRMIFDNFMMSGSPKAVEIARGRLKSILKSTGKPFEITGPEDFFGCCLSVSVKIKKDEVYGDKNVISYFARSVMLDNSNSDDLPF